MSDIKLDELRSRAREIFAASLRAVDADAAVRAAVKLVDEKLTVVDRQFDLRELSGIFCVALGKAALPMWRALSETLGAHLTASVIATQGGSEETAEETINARREMMNDSSTPSSSFRIRSSSFILPPSVLLFHAGHPLPNEASFASARAALALLKRANELSQTKPALVIFLVSGGGSAMMELPRDERVTLEELREANNLLVGCGATIAEINTVRRAWSQIKGGGLSRAAGRAAQVSLIISDTNAGDEKNVASGPTFADERNTAEKAKEIVARYNLKEKFSPSLLAALRSNDEETSTKIIASASHYALLDNRRAVEAAAQAAEARGFVVEVADDLVESPIAEGCRELVMRLVALRKRHERILRDKNRAGVALISGGEFSCPVRGRGIGGRNCEAALRSAILFDELRIKFDDERRRKFESDAPPHFVALHAGTDGIDGNSPAAGAISDETTLMRAAALGLDARKFLARSDSYNFFAPLGDAIITGATGTNVRDVRILLAH